MAAKDAESDKNDQPAEPDAMLDMSQAAVKKMISEARARGFITYDQLNQVLPPEQVSSEQIEDVMSMLSEMGINVIEEEEADEEAQATTEVVKASTSREVAVSQSAQETLDRTDDPVRMYLREMGSVELLSPRGRDRHRQADRGRAQHHDRGAVRKPADLSGDHHLARRTLSEDILLRDVIDLEATFGAGMERRATPS
jgi:RNA polymerase primary sigma factor